MHVADFDLNLLHVFQAVYATGHVGRAAERLGLSQPAVSHALQRLRSALQDPLFVRSSGGVRPTARAERFAHHVEGALRGLDVALQEAQSFEPATSARRFVLHMSDLATTELLPALMGALRREAPTLRIESVQLDPDEVGDALDDGRLDLAVGYLPQLQAAHRQALFSEQYVVLMRSDHPLRAQVRDRDSLEALEFILVRSHHEPAKALHRLGLEARIRLAIPHFAAVPPLLTQTDLAVIVPRRPALRYLQQAGGGALSLIEADLGLPALDVAIHWSWRVHGDPGQRWLRARVAEQMGHAPAA